MPVRFYPQNPIGSIEKRIVKEDGAPLWGEIAIYRKLHEDLSKSEQEWYVWHDLKLPRHSDNYNPYKKTSAQIDFLVLSKQGILVIEVKGGSISFKDNSFYYGNNFETRIGQNPFRQAEGYKYTLKDKILNSVVKCFFCHAVCFPHVEQSFNSPIIDQKILWTKLNSSNYSNSIELFLNSVYKINKERHKKQNRIYQNLKNQEINTIKNILSPIINDENKYSNSSTLEWLKIDNLEILDGLEKNKRIMIEGPPGSGKTTIAKAYIDRQIGKKGLYLCWNNLLMYKIRGLLKERHLSGEIEVNTLMRFLMKINPSLSYNAITERDEEGFYQLLSYAIENLRKEDNLPHYDYIVIDEGQDVFDRGVNLIIHELCGHGKGLKNSQVIILYDIDQSYINSGRSVIEYADIVSSDFSHFKLHEVKRSAQNIEIKELAALIFRNPSLLQGHDFSSNFTNIQITEHQSLKSAKKYIVHNFLNQLRNKNSSLVGDKCILLVESILLKNSYKEKPGMEYYLEMKDVEELTNKNIMDTSNKLRYTSILKYKGLEKDNVFLVITNRNKYETYVGVTRAICNLEILIVN